MASKYIYLQIVARVFFLTATIMLFAFIFYQPNFVLATIILVFVGIQVYTLIEYLNSVNRKVAFFFRSITNEDFTLHFPENTKHRSVQELNKSLNSVNGLFRNIHVKNKTQEQYYQEILKHAMIGILTFNEKGHIIFSNPTAKKLLNYQQLTHIKQLERVDKQLFKLFSNLKPNEHKLFQFENERETVHLSLKSTEVKLNNQKLTLVIIQDIHSELDEKETESWVRLIKVLTHEIMNSIAPITSLSESILSYYKKDNQLIPTEDLNQNLIQTTVKGLEVIQHQGENLIGFVKSYRSLSGIPLPDKQPLVVKEIFEKVKVLVSNEFNFDLVKFDIEVSPTDIEIFADEKQITLVLVNLIKNAIQSLGNQQQQMVQLVASLAKDGKKVIQVIDNGPGIKPELMDQIFIPFFTTKNEGSGIGLSFSKQIMRLHNGNISVNSTPFKETVFTLKL